VSNLFELLVVSSQDKRFGEWIKCFELLFGVSADQIMTDYNQLITLVNVTTKTYQMEHEELDYEYAYAYTSILYAYAEDLNSYDWTTLAPNRNRV